jgi:hypothetical protein
VYVRRGQREREGEKDINAAFSSHHSLMMEGEMVFRTSDFSLVDEAGCPGRCCHS